MVNDIGRWFGSVGVACMLVLTAMTAPARADEIWVAPTAQQDFGGLGIGSNTFWPATAAGVVRLAWSVPGNLQSFQSAKVALIPHAPGGAATLNVFVCPAQHADLVTANCNGPLTVAFTGLPNRLVEVDISGAIAPLVGTAGVNYLAVLAYTTPTTATDHIVGLRFGYEPTTPNGVATTAANSFSGTQTAPAFVGSGAGLTNLPVPAGVATLGANTLTGTQTIGAGNLDLAASTPSTGNLTKNGQWFLHNFGVQNTFLGELAGNFTLTGGSNAAVGFGALFNNTSGSENTASGMNALPRNTTGSNNTAHGTYSLFNNTTGSYNTATGYLVLFNNTTGGNNVAVGQNAGSNATTGSNNIYLGANVFGSEGDSEAIYLGLQGLHTKTVIGGIRGTSVSSAEAVYIDAGGRLGSGIVVPGANTVGTNEVVDGSLAPGDVAFTYAGSASKGGAAADLACTGCVNAGEVSFSFAGTGANTFTGTQTIDGGNLDLDDSTPTSGMITKNGLPFLHNSGHPQNIFMGVDAGSAILTGSINTAIGLSALKYTTTGFSNTAYGHLTLTQNITGFQNTAMGVDALNLSTGNANTALGFFAGKGTVGGANNIYLGAYSGPQGDLFESNAIYLGKQGTQTKTVIAGIRGITVSSTAIPVVIDHFGQLGTVSSSIRFKEDVHDMADASRRLLKLRPVTFRYTQASSGGAKPIQYGLIAEEVAEVFPELAVRDADGRVETVHYETLNVLLVNEVQKQQQRIEALEQKLNELLDRLTQ